MPPAATVEAARLSGVKVDARIILCLRHFRRVRGTVGIPRRRAEYWSPRTGEGYELFAIAACILGGVSLMGGEGNILGSSLVPR